MESLPPMMVAVSLLLFGCATTPDASHSSRTLQNPASVRASSSPQSAGTPSDQEPVSMVIDARPVALINGRSVLWGDLRPILNEAAGALALQEVLLDRKLVESTTRAGITITDDDAAAEQHLLLQSLSDDANQAIRLLDDLRNEQGLGPQRYRALLRRNAMLRALVRDRVLVTETAVSRTFDALHGPRRRVRLITTSDLPAAQAAIDRIRAGESFIEVAVDLSTDVSAARGGLLEPISRSDPSYPAAIRYAIWSVGRTGGLSDPTLLEDGYAIVQLIEELEGDGVSLEDVRPEIERQVRLTQERRFMDQLARSILQDASVLIFDESLQASWRKHLRTAGP